ncbi:MAG: ribbon-helix-helix domain-containing protein [Acidobacteriota bacterium]
MPKTKIAISLDPDILTRLDELVEGDAYKSRSQAVEAAIEEKLERLDGSRLVRETARLDPEFEKALAEEGMSEELGEWPAY